MISKKLPNKANRVESAKLGGSRKSKAMINQENMLRMAKIAAATKI